MAELTNTSAAWRDERAAIVTMLEHCGRALNAMPRQQPEWEKETYRHARRHLIEAMMWLEREDKELARLLASARQDFGG